MKQMFVYILKCSDGTYYTGVTNNIERRFKEHQEGYNIGSYTWFRLPVELVYVKTFESPWQAIKFEKRIKSWTKKKKEALINGDYRLLKELSRCRNHTSHKFFNKD